MPDPVTRTMRFDREQDERRCAKTYRAVADAAVEIEAPTSPYGEWIVRVAHMVESL